MVQVASSLIPLLPLMPKSIVDVRGNRSERLLFVGFGRLSNRLPNPRGVSFQFSKSLCVPPPIVLIVVMESSIVIDLVWFVASLIFGDNCIDHCRGDRVDVRGTCIAYHYCIHVDCNCCMVVVARR